MKKTIFGILIGFSMSLLIGAGIENYVAGKQTANVEMKSGLYIFTSSKPVQDYEYIATVQCGVVKSGYYEEVMTSIIKKVKKQYPNADGIIFIPNSQAEVIRFK